MTATTVPVAAPLLDVFVPGQPAPQGSMKAFVPRPGARPVVVKDNKTTQNSWRHDVSWTARAAFAGDLLDGPLSVRIEFVMRRPTSTPKRRTPPAVKKPDVDKLARAVLDALTSAVWRDDSQIVDLHATKRLAELGERPGARIRVAHHVIEETAA